MEKEKSSISHKLFLWLIMVSGGVFVEHQRFVVSSHAVVEFFDPLLNPLQVPDLCYSEVLQTQQTLPFPT